MHVKSCYFAYLNQFPLLLETLSNDDDDSSENVAPPASKMNLSSFKPNRVYLDPLRMSNAGDFSWC